MNKFYVVHVHNYIMFEVLKTFKASYNNSFIYLPIPLIINAINLYIYLPLYIRLFNLGCIA